MPLSFEAVYDRALNADVWVMRCGMAGVTYASLKKEREAYFLDLDNDSIPPLAVSKTYTQAVLGWFSKENPEKVDESAS